MGFGASTGAGYMAVTVTVIESVETILTVSHHLCVGISVFWSMLFYDFERKASLSEKNIRIDTRLTTPTASFLDLYAGVSLSFSLVFHC